MNFHVIMNQHADLGLLLEQFQIDLPIPLRFMGGRDSMFSAFRTCMGPAASGPGLCDIDRVFRVTK